MKKMIFPVAFMLAAGLLQSCGDTQRAKSYDNETQLDETALHFVKTVAESGNTEIEASHIAEQNSTNPRVKRFAQMMITDHGKAAAKLDTLARNKKADLPETLSEPDKNSIASLARLSGPDFDKQYMQMMVHDHMKAVQLFGETQITNSAATAKFAQKTLPTIEMHLDSAKTILASLK